MKGVFKFAMPFLQASLVKQNLVGLVLGIGLGLVAPEAAQKAGFLGTIFVTALKGVAPVLVFVLVMSSIANQQAGGDLHIKPILALYATSTFLAAAFAVVASFAWPTTIELVVNENDVSAPGGIGEVLGNLILNVVDNPVHAVASGNYIGILAWAIAMGVVLRRGTVGLFQPLGLLGRYAPDQQLAADLPVALAGLPGLDKVAHGGLVAHLRLRRNAPCQEEQQQRRPSENGSYHVLLGVFRGWRGRVTSGPSAAAATARAPCARRARDAPGGAACGRAVPRA